MDVFWLVLLSFRLSIQDRNLDLSTFREFVKTAMDRPTCQKWIVAGWKKLKFTGINELQSFINSYTSKPRGLIMAYCFCPWFSSIDVNNFFACFRPIGLKVNQWKKICLSSSSSPIFSLNMLGSSPNLADMFFGNNFKFS